MKKLIPFSASQLTATLSQSILDLHILPTERCNFRCVYCYEDFSIGKMSPLIVSSIKKLIANRIPELKQLRISWFGGEPLAAKDIVLDVSSYAQAQCRQLGIAYRIGMTTNGYLLTASCFESLIEAGITSYQISLDGPEEIHDQTRIRANGGKTFDTIWANLLSMAKTPYHFEVILRVHVTPQNTSFIPDLIHKIKISFKKDARFRVFFKAIANLGGPQAGKFDVLSGKEKTELLKQFNDMLEGDVAQHELNKKGTPYICYASSQNAWVIRADGSLSKCTVMLNDERNKIGKLQPNGTFLLDQNKNQLWLRGLKTLDPTIMGCPAVQL